MSCDLCKYCGDYAYEQNSAGEWVCSTHQDPDNKQPVDIEALKQQAYEDAKRKDMGRKPKRKYPSNYTPPKRRHRKKR